MISGLLKITLFWNKGHDVITPVDDVIRNKLSRDSIYTVDEFMWPKFGNSSISVKEVITTSILSGFDQKNRIFERWSWLKFNNLKLALSTNLKFWPSVAKGLKLKVRKFLGLIPTFVEVTGENWSEGRGLFAPPPPPPPPHIVLKRVETVSTIY